MSSFIAMSLRRLHHHHRLTALSPSVARSFCTTGHPSDEDHTPNNSEVNEKVGRKPSDIRLVNNSYYAIRYDVPGLTASDLTVWVDQKNDIQFQGFCGSEPKYDYWGGVYQATIPGCPSLCEMDQMKSELKHGVLWITLPLKEGTKNVIKMKHEFLKMQHEFVKKGED